MPEQRLREVKFLPEITQQSYELNPGVLSLMIMSIGAQP